MEAIVKISGKQYRVAEGDRVTVDRLAIKVGDEVTFDQVLLLTDGARATVGAPVVDGAAVTATVVAATRGPKLIVYKYKAKKRFRRTQGARAEQSLLEVLSVSGPGAKAKSSRAKVEAEAPEAKTEAATAVAVAPKAKTKTETAKAKPAAPRARATKAAAKAGGDEVEKPADKAKE